jgi:hypothetical protein
MFSQSENINKNMNPVVRRAFFYHRCITEHVLELLHAGTDEDSIFLSTIITRPMQSGGVCRLLEENGTPLALLYEAFIRWSPGLIPPSLVNHPNAALIHSIRTNQYLQVARKYNDPLAYDLTIGCHANPHKFAHEAAQAGSVRGIVNVALIDDTLNLSERRQLYMTLPPDWDFTDGENTCSTDYNLGRLLYAIGSKRRARKQAYYLDQWERMTRTVFEWMYCAKNLVICRDVARLIGRLVLKSGVIYERTPLRSSKRRKK